MEELTDGSEDDGSGDDDIAERVVIILVGTVGSFFAVFIFSMICVVRKCKQKRKYPDSQPLKKRVVVMRSNILYANSFKDQNSQVKSNFILNRTDLS